MPQMRAAGALEVWAARAWNVFNEGRPFSLVYPLLVLVAAAALDLAPDGPLALAMAGALALAAVPAAGPGAAMAGGAGLRAAARAVAGALAAGRRGGGVSAVHGRDLGEPLLPPANGRAVDQLHAVLAARGHELRPHKRQRAGAAAEVPHGPVGRDAAGGGAGSWVGGADRSGRRVRRPARLGRLAALRRAPAAGVSAAGCARRAGPGDCAPRLRDRDRRRQPRAHAPGAHAGHRPPHTRGLGVPGCRAGLSRAHGRLLLVDVHGGHTW